LHFTHRELLVSRARVQKITFFFVTHCMLAGDFMMPIVPSQVRARMACLMVIFEIRGTYMGLPGRKWV